jgi:hypothetical protein
MRIRLVPAAAALAVVGGCTSSAPPGVPGLPAGASRSVAASQAAAPLTDGCGSTPILRGALPAWTTSAGPPGDVPYVVSADGNVVGILYGYPFRAGTPTGRVSKVLWVVREPRGGSPLKIEGHPVGAASPTGHAEVPADAGPGEIYASVVDMPVPGCWHLTLTWNGNTAAVDLPYRDPAA